MTIPEILAELAKLPPELREHERLKLEEAWDQGFLTGAGSLPRADNPFSKSSAAPAAKRKR